MRIESLALAISLLVTPLAAHAENPCTGDSESWLAQSDSGPTGNGRSGGDEGGIGGTGYGGGDESGIGGTGIYGTITGFGSICVNGLRIGYDDETPVSVDGRASTSAALAIGQVVAVHATGRGEVLEATAVAIHRALTGPVTSLDYANRRLTVMGQQVIAPDDFSQEAYRLVQGSRVFVSGLRRSDGSVVATRIVQAPTEAPDSVSGIADTSASGELRVGGIRIKRREVESQDRDGATAESGQFVRVMGGWNTGTSTLEASVVSTTPLLRPDVERLSIEGYLEGPRLLGFKLDRPSLERALTRAHRGQRLRVIGRRNSLGHLRVERLQLVDRPQLRPEIDRPRPINLGDHPEPALRPTPLPPTRPKPPERPPKIERPDIDHPPRIDRVINRIDNVKVDRAPNFSK